jgi:hypothetical protein
MIKPVVLGAFYHNVTSLVILAWVETSLGETEMGMDAQCNAWHGAKVFLYWSLRIVVRVDYTKNHHLRLLESNSSTA